ncbi:MAG TPA: phosphoribosylaminoimidazolesuccinocarboxamide synthase, partial [Deltaproteobacteria bacterium]|nr:phosphoribosylaminoimidazolesuccinocarboxamide synthase [Deltaproteobacteria bacterium]
MEPVYSIDVSGARKISSGKVREIFDAGPEHMLMVTTDRISAFDVVLSDPIPAKGFVLNQISLFWFSLCSSIVPNHVVSADPASFPEPFAQDARLAGRSMLVRKARPLPVECIVRGYLSGSGWKEYLRHGSVSGIRLPRGLRESDRLDEPIFTPSTKAEIGSHDENIDMETACRIAGRDTMERVRDISLAIYEMACSHALERGIIIADTKFEFGVVDGGERDVVGCGERLGPGQRQLHRGLAAHRMP